MPNLNVGPKPIMNFNNQTPSSNFNRPNNTTSVNQNTPAPLSESEEFVLKSFEGYRDSYFETFSDETKQKDFNNKIVSLSNKLKNHDVKQNLLNILTEFINGKFYFFIF